MEKYFLGFAVKSISRNDNFKADELVKAASQNLPMPSDVFYQKLSEPAPEDTLNQTRPVATIEREDWRSPILAYLRGQRNIEDHVGKKRMAQRARNYKVMGNNLYKARVCAPFFRCIS